MARHQKIVVGLIIRDTPHRMGLCTFKGIPRVGTSRHLSIPYPDGLSVLSWNRPTCWCWTLSKYCYWWSKELNVTDQNWLQLLMLLKYKKSKIGIHKWKVLLMIRGPHSIGIHWAPIRLAHPLCIAPRRTPPYPAPQWFHQDRPEGIKW